MPTNLRQLTSLRFFAAMWVVAFHYWPSLTGGYTVLVDKGYLGVELFFVLSGFILAHVYLDAAGAGCLHYGRFLWARLARIYPVHLAALSAVGLMGAAATALDYRMTHSVIVWSALPQNLLLIQAWGTTRAAAWNHPSWSISAEWFAYVLFPLFAGATWALRTRPVLAMLGALGMIAILYPAFQRLAGFPLTRATIAWGALRIVPCFTLGCATNLLWRRRAIKDTGLALVATGLTVSVVVAGAVLNAPDPLLVMLFGALIYSLASMASSGSRVMTSAPLIYLGETSFALYMVCIPWQLVFSKAAARLFGAGEMLPLGLWLLQLVGVIGVAMAMHHVIERPARSWMRLHDPFRRSRDPASILGTAAATL
jgi:peptidoglycan/LPS O-acetylase OafA/YrhL